MKDTLFIHTDSNREITHVSPANIAEIKGGESVATQRNNILAVLRQAPATTIELREKLKIPSPAPRIFELRHNYGFHIVKDMVFDTTAQNSRHKVARYALLSEGV